jgi:UDP-glucose:(heptosyl)LPS alpha-1,3-glucosyltransferase
VVVRIGLVHKRLDLNGGTERDLYQTAEGLRDLGHEIHLFCSEYGVPAPSGTVAHSIPVVALGRTARLWSFVLFAQRIVRAENCDVVMGFGRMMEQDVLRSGGGTHRGFLKRLGEEGGTRRRFWQNISIYHRSLLSIERRQFNAPSLTKIIAVSEAVKREIVANYAVPNQKIVVLYNGVDQQRFHPGRRSAVRNTIRHRWKIPLDAPVVLFVGSGFRRKGLQRLLSIWRSPRLEHVYLLVVGNDARLNRYKAKAEDIGGRRIIFTGRQNDVENYYVSADVVALPALQEAFGNVVLEALASGVPVVVSRDVGAAELLSGALAEGIVDHPEDPHELETKLLSSLERARDPRSAEEARSIGQRYSWQNHFQSLEALLNETAESHSSRRVA